VRYTAVVRNGYLTHVC